MAKLNSTKQYIDVLHRWKYIITNILVSQAMEEWERIIPVIQRIRVDI